jgi:predicted amidohydrolase YtcJ
MKLGSRGISMGHAHRGRKIGALLFSLAVCCLPIFAQTPDPSTTAEAAKPKADIIFIHGNVYTGVPDNTPFSSMQREEAIAVRGDRIQALGKTLDILKLKGPDTKVVELGGHFVMPGFNDAHLHLDDAGTTKLSVDLTGVKSLDDLRSLVQKKVGIAKAGEWILGSGWDESLWPVKVTPTRWDLDEVSAGHPVFLVRIDGHIAVANTRALQPGEP